jgi:L-serine dehydratase
MAADLARACGHTGLSIAAVVRRNEESVHFDEKTDASHATDASLDRIWEVMLASIYEGCHTEGMLPGGLNVRRRAAEYSARLLGAAHESPQADWLQSIQNGPADMATVSDWLTAFALAVNEVNAGYGRIVTAPTNGAAGVIPAVLLYCICFETLAEPACHRNFLLTAGEIGSLFKKGATISAAMGGCQAEIGVSSAMAAAGMTAVSGGTPGQCMMAAEIAMEHHLGLTCDPIGGLVQIPCIERNGFGAIKAITAARMALAGSPADARVSLDDVIHTMHETAKDMNNKYKETAEGGLAIRIPISIPEC